MCLCTEGTCQGWSSREDGGDTSGLEPRMAGAEERRAQRERRQRKRRHRRAGVVSVLGKAGTGAEKTWTQAGPVIPGKYERQRRFGKSEG